ncbi:MAG: ABC transporter permease, partial [Planctomycetes bacterium]|nr:ABC transporter permease [Planctomycetota bacterium]
MYKLLLCQRYLRTRYIALASIISVTLGVATMIIVNSVMAGFSTQMKDRIRGILADIVIDTRNFDGEYDAKVLVEHVRRIVGKNLAGVTATVEVFGILSFERQGQLFHHPITLIGIDPATKSHVGPFVDYLQSYHPRKVGRETLPAERQLDEPPGWELTAAAMQHHQYRAELTRERSKWLRELKEQQHANAREPLPADSANQESIDPFGHKDEFEAENVAELAPQDARLIVGAAMVSFVTKDEETGEDKTVWMVQPGDDVKITTAATGTPPSPAYFNATVVDIFQSGMNEYDSSFVYCNLEYLQQVRKMILRNEQDGSESRAVTSIQIKLKDFSEADQIVDRLRSEFGPERYTVRTWEQKQGPLLAAVDVESSILNILLFLIIAVAG